MGRFRYMLGGRSWIWIQPRPWILGWPGHWGWLTALHCSSFRPQRLRCPSFSPRSSSCNVNTRRVFHYLKLHKLKLRIEIRLMETRQFCKNSHTSQKNVFTLAWGVFQAIWKRNISQNCNRTFFFCVYRSHGVCKSQIIILQCTITSKKHIHTTSVTRNV